MAPLPPVVVESPRVAVEGPDDGDVECACACVLEPALEVAPAAADVSEGGCARNAARNDDRKKGRCDDGMFSVIRDDRPVNRSVGYPR